MKDDPIDVELSAARMLAWRADQLKLELPSLPEAALLTHQPGLLRRRLELSRPASLRVLSFYARTERFGNKSAVLAACNVGAPASAIAVEELAALGTKRLLVLDIAGSFEADLPSGTTVVVQGALCGDGTSPHYTDEAIVRPESQLEARLSAILSRQGIHFANGIVWSTDAVYRETRPKIDAARSEGAQLVDMETAAVFAAAAATGIAAAAILVVADELHDGWRPPSSMVSVRRSLRELMKHGIACLLDPAS